MKSVCDSYASGDSLADDKLVGQRNENSVLFSLANLRLRGTAAPAARAASVRSSERAIAADGGSGLIELRVLARAGGLGVLGGPAAPPKSESVDDPLSIGSCSSPFAPTRGAPMLAPPRRERRSAGLIIGIGLGVATIVVAATIILVAVFERVPASLVPGAIPAPPPALRAGAMPQSDDTHTPVDHAASTPTRIEPSAPSAPAEVDSGGNSEPAIPARHVDVVRHSATARVDGRRESARELVTATETTARTNVVRSPSDTVEQILDRVGTNVEPLRVPARDDADVALPAQLTRAQVLAGLSAVRTAAAACGVGQHGLAMTAITVAGSSGSVTSAIVSGQFAGTPVGSCVARAARAARFQRFRGATFSVSFPFAI